MERIKSYIQNGYRYVYRPNHPKANKRGYVLEHRLVMEEKLGRYLEDYEIVHPKDGNRLNNHPDNLELTNRSDHMGIHWNNDWEHRRSKQQGKIRRIDMRLPKDIVRKVEEYQETHWVPSRNSAFIELLRKALDEWGN